MEGADVQVVRLGGKERLERLLVAGELEVGRLRQRKVGLKHAEGGDVDVDAKGDLKPRRDRTEAGAAAAAADIDKLHDRRASLLCETMKIFIR